MKLLFVAAFSLLSCQRFPVRPSAHWCEEPVQQLRWLSQLMASVRSFAARGGWEMHQAYYQRREVFVLYLIVPRATQSTFIMYDHYGDEVYQGPVAESLILPKLQNDRMLAGVVGRHNLR